MLTEAEWEKQRVSTGDLLMMFTELNVDMLSFAAEKCNSENSV